jgi:hypothetical protein
MNERPENDSPGDGTVGFEWIDLFPVYEAADEPSAIHVQAMLQSAGITARIRSAQIPAFDGVFASAIGFWGQVMVPRDEVVAARALIKDFVRDAERGGPSLRWPPPELGEDEPTEASETR